MTPDRISQLLADGEGMTIEYKECVNGLGNSVWETMRILKRLSGKNRCRKGQDLCGKLESLKPLWAP